MPVNPQLRSPSPPMELGERVRGEVALRFAPRIMDPQPEPGSVESNPGKRPPNPFKPHQP